MLTIERATARPARALWMRAAQRLEGGRLEIVDGHERRVLGDAHAPLGATLRVKSARFYRRVLLRGDLGAGEAYVDGDFDCDGIVALGRIALRNRLQLEAIGRVAKSAHGALAGMLPSSRARSRRRIAAHYDLGNDFFGSFLDETMAYSCAWFDHAHTTLFEASRAKHERVCDKLELSAEDHLLDLGGGWGGLALHAAHSRGCRVTTVTLSASQHALVRERVARAGLGGRITALHADYRELHGRYDKIASIEMLEAVGHAGHRSYFAVCHRLLRPGGRMLLQTITVPDERYESARRRAEFVKLHVFPGGCLPSLARIRDAADRLEPIGEEDLTAHYVPTLCAWRERFADSRPSLLARGTPERLLRTWEWYLGICEASFAERHTGDVQLLFARR